MEIDVHGGMTYGSEGDDFSGRTKDKFWYGWDYGHFMDQAMYEEEVIKSIGNNPILSDGHKWIVPEVIPELQDALNQFEEKYSGIQYLITELETLVNKYKRP